MADGEEIVLVQVGASDGSSLRHVRELIFEYTQARHAALRFSLRFPCSAEWHPQLNLSVASFQLLPASSNQS